MLDYEPNPETASVKKSGTPRKILHLEGLRGILALMVFIHHFVLLFYPSVFVGTFSYQEFKANPAAFSILVAHSPLNIFMNGHLAVCIFLVNSGYVLTLSYKESGRTIVLQRHALKRYIRLVIPVLGACLFLKLLFATGMIEWALYPKGYKILELGNKLFKSDHSLWEVITTSLFKVPLSGSTNFLTVLWTIQLEFLGALCLFAFWLFTHRSKWKLMLALAFITGCLYLSHVYYPLLLAGGFICMYEDKLKKFFRSSFSKLILLLLALFLGGIVNTEKNAIALTMYAFTLYLPFEVYSHFHNVSAILLVIVCVTSRQIAQVFSMRYFVLFGKLTFSFYLLHLPVLYCLGSRLMWLTQGKIHVLLLLAACFCMTVFIALPFYWYVDKTAIRLSNRFSSTVLPHSS